MDKTTKEALQIIKLAKIIKYKLVEKTSKRMPIIGPSFEEESLLAAVKIKKAITNLSKNNLGKIAQKLADIANLIAKEMDLDITPVVIEAATEVYIKTLVINIKKEE